MGIILVGITTVIGWPTDGGNILLVPFSGTLANTVNLALAEGGRVVDAAPSVGGVIVSGDASVMVGPMLRHGTLLIGVPAAFCGSSSKNAKVVS